jgi:predicted AAA+ superfamily ATPase
MVKRLLAKSLQKRLFKGKAILLIGPRQVGKTTLVRQICDELSKKTTWLNGDEADVRELLSDTTSTRLKNIVGTSEIVVIDEAQRIRNIGLALKLITDEISNVQVIAAGSSAFELANEIKEPLTGRKYELQLFPFCFSEMVNDHDLLQEQRLLEHRLIYGYYPEVVNKPDEAKVILQLITDSYLYKDLFSLQQIKKPMLLEKLVQALSFQIGNEVSNHELAQLIGADNETVERYLDLLEKAFVIFRLSSFSRNLRNELKKSRKIYFWDNGIRNAVIRNYNPMGLRQDGGALWENWLVSERQKINHYSERLPNKWFWRTHAKQEIDYLEEYNGKLRAWEIKWNEKVKDKIPASFLNAYSDAEVKIIDKKNYQDWLINDTNEQ